MTKCSLIVTVKNRLNQFLQTFPSAISQYGVDYELIYVNFHSNDKFEDHLRSEASFREPMFSPYLKRIKQVKLLEDLKFSPRKSKNMSIPYTDPSSKVLAFSDADVFISSNYLHYWSKKVIIYKSFVATRVQDSMASIPSRIKKEINYGNFLVSKKDFIDVRGLDESIKHYGGDDDDIYHRLKLKGLREINPYNAVEARNYSILHGDELRLGNFEVSERGDTKSAFERIYYNRSYLSPESKFLDLSYLKDKVAEETIFEKE
tara:strand:+ start:442 stop:1224 length:783 start_codon:yes stop_codon:yes gene_type:complete